jgi:hypothetical protein
VLALFFRIFHFCPFDVPIECSDRLIAFCPNLVWSSFIFSHTVLPSIHVIFTVAFFISCRIWLNVICKQTSCSRVSWKSDLILIKNKRTEKGGAQSSSSVSNISFEKYLNTIVIYYLLGSPAICSGFLFSALFLSVS